MKQLLVLLLLISVPTQLEEKDSSLTVITYNIHHAKGIDNNVDIQRIADVINQSNADIVALQEVDINTNRSGNIDMVAILSELTNLPFTTFGKNLNYEGGKYGNAILSKYPIKEINNFQFENISGEQRGILTGIISVNQSDILFLNTHLDHTGNDDSERILYINKIIEEIIPSYSETKTILLAGDLNDIPGSKTYQKTSNVLKDAWKESGEGDGFTIPVKNSNRRIDYIFYSGNIESIKSTVLYSEASDHLPVVVRFMLSNE